VEHPLPSPPLPRGTPFEPYAGAAPPPLLAVALQDSASADPWTGLALDPAGPQPYMQASSSNLLLDTVLINGVPVTYAVRNVGHRELVCRLAAAPPLRRPRARSAAGNRRRQAQAGAGKRGGGGGG
jgi:hypothetical protein